MNRMFENKISETIDLILKDYNGEERVIDQLEDNPLPEQSEIISLIDALFQILFPGCYHAERPFRSEGNRNRRLALLIENTSYRLRKQIKLALRFRSDMENSSCDEVQEEADRICLSFLTSIPSIRADLEMDLQAAFDGDPAAAFRDEILLCYPGFYAISVNRLAHALFLEKVPLIPRIMTEHAHSRTGIDIHPGATIGKYFFIDHGTGVVIGETTLIGNNVKLYQGVTLGALSTRGGQSLRGKRRHPTIEDNVTIYSGASILGGETVIGSGSVIGSNAFITKPIAPGTRVSIKNQELVFKSHKPENQITDSFDDTECNCKNGNSDRKECGICPLNK